MGVKLSKEALDLGIITRDGDAMLAFYRDVVGLPFVATVESSIGLMHRLAVGASVLKLVQPPTAPTVSSPSGGEPGDASGPRYFTLRITNIDDVMADCEQAGAPIVWSKRPLSAGGGWVSLVEDPDGNLLEFVQDA
jgi:predicted enzyme related to lactoylglutathione lyase